jgi:hypothetical protein
LALLSPACLYAFFLKLPTTCTQMLSYFKMETDVKENYKLKMIRGSRIEANNKIFKHKIIETLAYSQKGIVKL